jgi:hypothetical protein
MVDGWLLMVDVHHLISTCIHAQSPNNPSNLVQTRNLDILYPECGLALPGKQPTGNRTGLAAGAEAPTLRRCLSGVCALWLNYMVAKLISLIKIETVPYSELY